ncbi:DMT family transporter [Paraburkholderia strydomiana]|uniref:DMT family transporter n=1 Tax=Paraburkholderia strydomiana TaxID=1245417 RepID=UPI00286772EC|nr:DMT family transporter [Paraburkholderia strydomiana]MDR7003533.1 drug/metabolite transporter (DMT)-like permease [Paraburkholderia strydomiana]
MNPNSRDANRVPLPMLEAGMVLTWSSGFVGMRFSADYAPVLLVLLWRFITLSLCLFPFVAREIRSAPLPVLIRQSIIGVFATAGYLAGVARGIELGVPTGLAALIADLLPVAVVIISTCVFREHSPKSVWAGLALGLAGMLIVCRDAVALGKAPAWAYALPVAGMVSLAAATVWQQRSTARAGSLSPLCMLWLQSVVSCPVFLWLQASHGNVMPIATVGFAASVAWTAILATLGGWGLYWTCLRRSSSARVTSVLFLSPPITLIWAWAMFREPLSWPMAIGMGISGLGVLLVVRRDRAGGRLFSDRLR